MTLCLHICSIFLCRYITNKDPKNFKVSVISCMPIKPAHAFQAFQKEGEGVINKARENALGNHVLCLTKRLNIPDSVFFAFT